MGAPLRGRVFVGAYDETARDLVTRTLPLWALARRTGRRFAVHTSGGSRTLGARAGRPGVEAELTRHDEHTWPQTQDDRLAA